jgi:phosphoglycolate phosphatase-like HAD superfamily hydrolase
LTCRVDPARQSLLVEFVETYLPLVEHEQAEFQQIVTSDRKYAEVERMITVYEKRGIEKGIQQGKQEDLIVLLEKKFGKLSATFQRRIRQIESPAKLQSLLLAVLDADSLEDLPF